MKVNPSCWIRELLTEWIERPKEVKFIISKPTKFQSHPTSFVCRKCCATYERDADMFNKTQNNLKE